MTVLPRSVRHQFGSWLDVLGELLLLPCEGAEVTLYLNAMPELIRLAEEGSKTNRHCGSDCPLTETISFTARGGTPIARAMAF